MTIYHKAHATKRVGELLDYSIDWSMEMASDEVITTSTWTVSDVDPVTKTGEGQTDKIATVWIEGGVACRISTVENIVTTDQGRRFVGDIAVHVE